MKRKILLALFVLLGVAYAQAQTRVTGKVTDAEGDPIPSARVVVKGMPSVGTVTDLDGAYAITLPESATTLIFSSLDSEPQEVNVNGRSIVNVTLQKDVKLTEEVVLVGYTTKRKGAITGNIGTVDGKKLESIPVANATQLLQGQTAGVMVISGSGRPGASGSLYVRGIGSLINGATDPLYIIDGVPSTGSQFAAINTNDIESFNILKDAAATAIYGSRAANGVVLVTTKTGKGRENNVTYKGLFAVSTLPKDRMEMMNTREKLDYEVATGLLDLSDANDLAFYNRNMQYDYYQPDEMFRNAKTWQHEISVNAGSEKSRVFFSGSYFKQEGIVERSELERYTGRLTWDQTVNDWLKVGTNVSVGYTSENFSVTADEGYSNNVYSPIFAAYLINPYERLKNDDGSWKDGYSAGQTFERWTYANPMRELTLNDDITNNLNIRNSTYAEISLPYNIKFRSTLGFNYNASRSEGVLSPNSVWGEPLGGRLSRSFPMSNRFVQNNVFTYQNLFAEKHDLSVMIGNEIDAYYSESASLSAKGVAHPSLKVLDVYTEINGAPGFSGGKSEVRLASFFGTVNYNYDDKYFVDFSVRTDGSSRLYRDSEINNQWGTFWAVGLAWNMKAESFLRDVNILSSARLRGSIGTSGNQGAIGAYAARGTYGYGTYGGETSSGYASTGKPDLSWESQLKMDLGFEVGFVDNRYTLDFGWFRRNSYDMLIEREVSRVGGYSTYLSNLAKMHNTGIEIAVKAEFLKTKDWTVGINGNVAYITNEIDKLFGGSEDEQTYANVKMKVGHPYGEYYKVHWAGVDAITGNGMWYDKNGNVTSNFSTSDAVMLGKQTIPKWTGGLTLNAQWKNIGVSAFFTGAAGRYTMNRDLSILETSSAQYTAYQKTTRANDFWRKPGDVASIARLDDTQAHQNAIYDTRLITKTDYVRFKNLTVSYTFNSKLLNKTKIIKGLRVYFIGENIATFTGYRGFDPESMSNLDVAWGSYPTPRTFSFGLDITF